MPGFDKCDVNGDGLCNLADKTILSRALAGLGPGIQPRFFTEMENWLRKGNSLPQPTAEARGRRSSAPLSATIGLL
jgi:hypothetical protein